jgi:hypothetical protein
MRSAATAQPAAAAGAPLSFEQKREALKKLFFDGCSLCHLSKSRTKMVFGSGNVDAPVCIIGEAPGEEEDLQGLPFVGAAGQLLTQMLAAVQLDRAKDTFITNVLKCRPPGNRNPESAEIQTCVPLLKKTDRDHTAKSNNFYWKNCGAYHSRQCRQYQAPCGSQVFRYNTIPVW